MFGSQLTGTRSLVVRKAWLCSWLQGSRGSRQTPVIVLKTGKPKAGAGNEVSYNPQNGTPVNPLPPARPCLQTFQIEPLAAVQTPKHEMPVGSHCNLRCD